MTEENLLTQWSRLLLSSLADAGVRDVVLSPGSRSTPFMVAAARDTRLRCHDSIDERAASFFALGQARVTGRPSLLICTSGTAAAHYLPAVVEASLAYIPLLVLTADRPLELQDCAAPQTFDQIKLMGDHVRRFYELGTPEAAPSALIGLRRLAAQAMHYTLWPTPGPVHLNARARKPLEPAAAASDAGEALETRVDELLARPIVTATPPAAKPDIDAVERTAAICRGTERGLIVCGPGPLRQRRLREAIDRLARATGFPVLAESTSQLRLGPGRDGVVRCDAFDAILRSPSFRERHRPDVVLQIGAAPVSGGYEQYGLAHTDVTTIVFAPHGWQDPLSRATELILGDPLSALEQLERTIGTTASSRSEWSDAFDEADRRAWAVVDTEIADGDDRFSEGTVVRTVLEHVPNGSLVMLGNSLSVREVDTFCRPGSVDVDILCQRGANGIDGIVAGASGSAAAQEQPVTVLLGDVSFLHDLTGLALAGRTGVPVVVVVVNNNGGRLFEQLPLASVSGLPAAVMEHVTTPHDAQLEHAALLFGHRYGATRSAPELAELIDEAYAAPGCTVVEARVSANGAAAQHRRVFAGIAAAVDELAAPLATGSEW
jgi:2-succinyl-5-enolpyruvyl-6-hydroxy-3-cyclohexene-1-carboxylate synthase